MSEREHILFDDDDALSLSLSLFLSQTVNEA
jgi:hypothetical protein